MSTQRSWLIVTGLTISSLLLIPEAVQARGGGGGGGAGAGAGGAMVGGGGMPIGGSPAFGGGAAFGSALGGRAGVTPRPVPFPFIGGGAGFIGGFPVVSQPYLLPPPLLQPEQVMGPMQVQVSSPAAQPLATATRTIFVNGMPNTVSSPMIMQYHWPSNVAKPQSQHGYARTIE